MYPVPVTHLSNSNEIKLCDAPESNRVEIGPIELATKCRGKSKKGVSVCLATLNKVSLDVVLHMVSYCIAVSAHAASHVPSPPLLQPSSSFLALGASDMLDGE